MKHSKKYMILGSAICLMGLGIAQAKADEKVKFKVQTTVMKCEKQGEIVNCNPLKDEGKEIELNLEQSNTTPSYPTSEWNYQIEADSITFNFGITVDKFIGQLASENGYYFTVGLMDSRFNEPNTSLILTDSPDHLNKIELMGKQINVGNISYYPILVLSPSSK